VGDGPDEAPARSFYMSLLMVCRMVCGKRQIFVPGLIVCTYAC
jgi:hypothetical protein